MKMLKEFIIPFSSLKFGSNFHEFEIDKTFFEAFNYSRYEFCNIILQIDFRKENEGNNFWKIWVFEIF